ncbi:MAG: hypothetical protein LH628_25895 [Microcoleus sp. CAN_BIN18]|nr:hypothetical protein [Microcoleus sp. CAN_BIN18]
MRFEILDEKIEDCDKLHRASDRSPVDEVLEDDRTADNSSNLAISPISSWLCNCAFTFLRIR